ncbi:hypothetical protein [uncultured Mediterranean phage uvDeep-CGR2-KM19-C269]|nr:hypothetical protein [uncultured Mediterranean phage uvDeep-CGR2-KM19-C269]
MIHYTLTNTLKIIGTTQESRINNSVPTENLRFLIKFTSEFSGKILYAYGTNVVVKSRFTSMEVNYSNINNALNSEINLIPAGYWKYEIFEVSYNVTSSTYDDTNTPKTEVDVLTVSDENGVVQGRVDIGKLHVHNVEGNEENEYVLLDGASDNYIYPYGEINQQVNNNVDKFYQHTQIAALDSWTITHNLQKFPSVTVVDSAGSKVTGEVDYIDINTLTVSFTAEFGGTAYLN